MSDNLGDSINNFNDGLDEGKAKFRDLRAEAEALAGEVGKSASASKKAGDAYNGLSSILEKLQGQQEGINRLSDSQLDKLQEQAKFKRLQLENALSLNTKLDKTVRLEDVRAQTGTRILDLSGGAFENALRTAIEQGKITEEEMALLRAKKDTFKAEQGMLDAIDEEVAKRKESNRLMGVSGGIIKGLTSLTGDFGKAFKLDQVAEDMQELSDKIANGEEEGNRFTVMAAGMGSAIKNAFATITDPATIFAAAIKGFTAVDKANVEFQRQTGQSLNTMSTQAAMANTHFITLGDYIKTASELTKELGQNAAAIFEPEDLMEAAEMVEAMGMASKEAANLAKFSKINGGNIEAQNKAIIEGVNAANRQNKTAVGAGTILKDVANTSEEIAISYAGYPEKLGAAATAAKGLGMSLSDVDKIASSLLQFESSIAAELEAELLTGKALNLEKARQLALDNDLEGVATELANQGITAASFSRMNRIQQEAQAKALGMNRQELSKMLLTQKATMDLSEDALSNAQKQTLEQVKQEEASEKFNKSIQKIQQALAPIVEPIADFLAGVAGVVSGFFQLLGYVGLLKPLLIGIASVVALIGIGKAVKGFKEFAGTVKESFDTVKGLGKGIADLATGKGSGALKEAVLGKKDKAKEVTKDAQGRFRDAKGRFAKAPKDKVKEAGDQMEPGKSKGIKENLTSLGEGLKAMAGGKVTQGILNLALAGPALILALPSIPFLLFIGLTPLSQISSNLENLSQGLENMSGAKVLLGIGNLALAGTSLLLALPSIPFLLFIGLTPLNKLETNFTSLGDGLKKMSGGPIFTGIGALALAGPALAIANLAIPFLTFMALPLGPLIQSGLTGLANGLSYLGRNFANVLLGSVALGAVGLALGGSFALAMTMIKDVNPSQMIAFAGSLTMLGLTMALLGNIGANVMMGAAAMGVLALSLIPAAFAFSLLAGVDVGSMIAFSVALPLLSLAAAGLGFIAPFIMAGAGALAVLGLALIPASIAFGMIQGLDTNSIISFAGGISILALAAAGLGFAAPLIIAGSFAMTTLGLALIPASIAFGMIQGLDTNSIISFSKGIGVLALAAAGLGFASPFILAGAGALTMLGLALIPASIAFGMIQGLDTNSIISFATGVGILASTVALLGFAAPLITAGSFAMTALGLALIPLSIGFERMAAANVEGLVNSLQGLAGVTPQLFGVAAGLGAISAGLAGIAGAGFLALPAIGALTALGTVSEGLGSIFGGKADNKTATKNEEKSDNKIEVKDEGSMKAIEQKLDQLIAVVSKGGDVYIDGSKVGKTLQLATSRMG